MRHGNGKDFDPTLLAIFFRNLAAIREIAARHPDEPRGGTEFGVTCLAGGLAGLVTAAEV
jgi:hypothetical protein